MEINNSHINCTVSSQNAGPDFNLSEMKFDLETGKHELPPNFIRPDQPSKCTWSVSKGQKESPHTHFTRDKTTRSKICPDVLYAVGETPLVRLNKIPQEENISCQVFGKCEFLNPGGSVKDRIAVRMIEDAEKSGKIRPGDVLVEPTSGNTGIGLAVAAVARGYKLIVVLPDKNSQEKEDIIRGLGAVIVRTPTNVTMDDPTGDIAVAQKIAAQIPRAFVLDQYRNPSNPLSHYDTTAEEIIEQCDGQVDMVVMGTGTGGTVTGVGRKLREKCPNCIIVGVDPEGSTLAHPTTTNETEVVGFHVEGIGYDFVPTVLDQSIPQMWVKTNDKDSFLMARRLIREEGLLVGGSSGAALFGAIQAIRQAKLRPDQKCVVIFPDGIRNYMTKFLNDDWMIQHDFLEPPPLPSDVSSPATWYSWQNGTVADLLKFKGVTEQICLPANLGVKAALDFMKRKHVEFYPVVDDNQHNHLLGIVSLAGLLNAILSKDFNPQNCPIKNALEILKFARVTPKTALLKLAYILKAGTNVIVVRDPHDFESNGKPIGNGSEVTASDILGVLTQRDFLNFITSPQ